MVHLLDLLALLTNPAGQADCSHARAGVAVNKDPCDDQNKNENQEAKQSCRARRNGHDLMVQVHGQERT